jgi:hypothetical protein
MKGKSLFASLMVVAVSAISSSIPSVRGQTTPFTLMGEWLVKSQAINGRELSPKGNTLGFPDRDMFFTQDGDLRTGFVVREDVGLNVKPLGVWRVEGSNFSSAFELWCPDASGPCGSVIMRGTFSDPNTISGTMSVFFEVEDDTTPTGLDTWVFSFTGTRK